MRRKISKDVLNHRLHEARLQHRWSQQDVADRLGTTVNTVSRWELGNATPGPHFRAKLCEIFHKSAQDLGLVPEQNSQGDQHASSPTPWTPLLPLPSVEHAPVWFIPHPRNPHFTGRDGLLDQLDQRLSPYRQDTQATTRRIALAQPQAIKGLGGIGKTQIALEYAYRAREQSRYHYILWLNAASSEALMSSFVALADLLPSCAAKDETDQRKLVAVVKRWLEQCEQPWLLILDNADDLSLIQEFLPAQGTGSILLTTRASAVGSLAASLEVDIMSMIESTHLLLRRAQRLEQASDEEINETGNLVIALDHFPLALDQAGAYIEETGCSFSTYLQLYQKHRKDLLTRRGGQATNYPDSVATTWSLSFQRLEQTNPAAVEFLRLCAFLAPDHIPEELFTEGAAYWPPVLQEAMADPFTFNHLLEETLKFSLVKRLAKDRRLSIHRLVQAVQMDAMEPGEQRKWAERVVCAVNEVFPRDPKGEVAVWPQCLRYLEQAQACSTLIQQYALELPEAAYVLSRTGTYLREHASYTLAEPLYQQALRIQEQQLGPEHLEVASSLNNLAHLYHLQGKYPQAEPLFQRALWIKEQQLGPEHPEVASSLNNLANPFYEQGKYMQAEPLYQRALCIQEQQLGPEHPQLANSLNNLANLYYQQEKYMRAEPLYQRALWIKEQQLGPEHPQITSSLINLANLYYQQGKYMQAEPLYQRALRILEQHFGAKHPQVAYALTGLADLYREQGQYTEAEPLYQRALSIREQALDPHHPATAETLHGFAVLREAQGIYQEASSLYQQSLAIREQILGYDHQQTVQTRTQYLALLQAMDRESLT